MNFNYDDALKEIEEINDLTDIDEAKQRIRIMGTVATLKKF